MIRVAILDDEQKSIKSLVYELGQFKERVELVAQFTQVGEAWDQLKGLQLDCLFLDIEMPQMDGFGFLEQCFPRNFEVVFVTAYSEYAIQALREHAFDYLLKPVDGEDLGRVLARLEEKKKLEQTGSGKILINTDQELHLIDPNDIVYCSSEGSYSWVVQGSGSKILVSKNLKHLEYVLPEDYFFRIHQSYLVNIRRINLFDKTQSSVILDSGASLPISRLRKKEFLESLKSQQGKD